MRIRSISFRLAITCGLFVVATRAATAQTATWVGSGSNASFGTATNWSGTFASNATTHLVIGSGFASGTTLQQTILTTSTNGAWGLRIGSLSLTGSTPFSVVGSPLLVNGTIRSTGPADRSVTATLAVERATTVIDVAAGSGRLTLGTIQNASGTAATIRKINGGDLSLVGSSFSTGMGASAQASTFTLQDGSVTLGGSLRQGFTTPSSSPLGLMGTGSFTAGVLRLEGGTLRAIPSTSSNLNAQYFAFAVTQDTVLSGTAAFGDPAGVANAQMRFLNGFRLERDSQLVVHNDTTLSRMISGSHALTVTGGGRLNLSLNPLASGSAAPLARLVVDGGGLGLSGSAALPADGVTLRNGGRLDSLSGVVLSPGRKITIEGSGVLRSANSYSFADLVVGSNQLQGSGTLRIESTQPVPLPGMPAGYALQPGRIRITGSNGGFTGDTVVAGGELVIQNQRALGTTFVVGGTQTVTVNAGILTLSGGGVTPSTDLSRVAVNRGGTLKFASGANVVLTASTSPVQPIAGMVGLEFATLSGSGAGVGLRVTDGAIIQNSGSSTSAATLNTGIVYAGHEAGTVTLAGTYIPNRRALWGGELNVLGQLQRDDNAGNFNLLIQGAGVNLNVAQASFTGSTTIGNGRLSLGHVHALGQPSAGRAVHIRPGGQLDITSGSFSSAAVLPVVSASSAGMVGFGPQVPNEVVRGFDRGQNSIGPAYYADYVYSGTQSLDAVDGVYRFGTVSTGSSFGGTWQVPRAFAITQPDILTGSASVIVGAPRGDALGSASSMLRIGANQGFTGGVTVRPDFFLGVDRNVATPFGTGTVTVQGRLIATGTAGSFTQLADPGQIVFAKGGELWLDNSLGVNSDRWGNATPVSIQAGAVRLSGRSGTAVSETIGAVSYSGGSRIHLDNLGSGSTSLTVASLTPVGPHATLEIHETTGNERLFVTQAPTTMGAARLVPGVIDRRTQSFVTWSSTTGELTPAPQFTSSLTLATGSTYVGLSGTVTATASRSVLALRTTGPIITSGTGIAPTLTIGDGSTAQLLAAHSGSAQIQPNLVFSGEGIVYTGSGARTALTGVVTATSGLVKLGPGDLILSNTTSLAGAAMQDLIVREGRLSGSGSRMWNVIVEGSGVFAPGNSPDVSEVGGLTLTPDSGTLMELSSLDAVSDRIDVAGNVVLDGFIDVADWAVDDGSGNMVGTMEVGTYDLITWGGSMTNNGIALREMPEGFDGYLNLDTQNRVLQLVVVPEPAGIILGLFAVAGGFAIRRRGR